jgi:hypothetical protein
VAQPEQAERHEQQGQEDDVPRGQSEDDQSDGKSDGEYTHLSNGPPVRAG